MERESGHAHVLAAVSPPPLQPACAPAALGREDGRDGDAVEHVLQADRLRHVTLQLLFAHEEAVEADGKRAGWGMGCSRSTCVAC